MVEVSSDTVSYALEASIFGGRFLGTDRNKKFLVFGAASSDGC